MSTARAFPHWLHRTLAPVLSLSWVTGCTEPNQPQPATPTVPAPALAVGGSPLGPVDLGTLGGPSSLGLAVNDAGQVAGNSSVDLTGQSRPFLWERGEMIDLGALEPESPFGFAFAVNSRGQVVGSSGLASGDRHAFLWESGVMTDLGTLGGAGSQASDINEHGVIVGQASTATGETHAFLWMNGTMRDLGTLGGTSSFAFGVNNLGQVVGTSTLPSGEVRPFLWQDGSMTELGTLGGTFSAALDINDRGQVVGDSRLPNGETHAVLWQNGAVTDLGTLGGRFGRAQGINELGQVVGFSTLADGRFRAFLWEGGTMRDLGTLGGATGVARAINERGDVVGWSSPARGPTRATLWTRTAPGPTALAQLRFETQPGGASGGTPLTTQPVIELLDSAGRRVRGTAVSVTIAFGTNPVGGHLSGTTTVTTFNGLAAFRDLSIDRAGAGYTLVASAAGISSPPSAPFDVLVGPAAAESSIVNVDRARAVPGDSIRFTLRARDAGGNNISTGGLSVAFTVSGGTSEGSIGPTTDHANGAYTATFVAEAAGTPLTVGATINGSQVTNALPTIRVVRFTTVTASFTSSPGFSCGLLDDGAAYCWGDGLSGTLGQGSFQSSAQPQQVSGGFLWTTVAGGWRHVCGLTETGLAYCWGSGDGGALGNGSSGQGSADRRNTPVPVSTDRTWSFITASFDASCAIEPAGSAHCWGTNVWGRLGDGGDSPTNLPRVVVGDITWGSIGISIGNGCGLSADGAAYCWGYSGFLLTGGTDECSGSPCALAPLLVPGGFTFRPGSITLGGTHACAVTTDGLARCWGANGNGQLGDGSYTYTTVPVLVAGNLRFAQLDAGDVHTCGVTESGDAYCWGANDNGQLGDGTFAATNTPHLVMGDHHFSRISTGQGHTCGVSLEGAALCWGRNDRGQLGDGVTGSPRPTPERVKLP